MKKFVLLPICMALSAYAQSITLQDAPQNPAHRAPTSANEILSFNGALEKPLQSVVNISTKRNIEPKGKSLEEQEEILRYFFGQNYRSPAPKERIKRALGSGVILSSDGYIVTNNHVVANADAIVVNVNADKKEYSAKLIGTDPGSDLAIIKIEADNLQPITLGDAKDIRLGDVVFAIGNPFGVGETVTQGIVSALNKHSMGINRYENFIQTDASINPGNSGGALVDSRGALIGINSAIISPSGGNDGVGFTIPVDMVRDVASKLVEEGRVERGYLGVAISGVTDAMKGVYTHTQGAVVTDIQPGSASEKAGLKRGDLIFAVDGKAVDSPNALQQIVGSFKPKRQIEIALERDKKEMKVLAKLGDQNQANTADEMLLEGMSLALLDKNTKEKFGIAEEATGVLIAEVKSESQAQKDGFQAGDVIIQIENQTIASLSDIKQALQKGSQEPKRVYINRNGTIVLLVAH